jgi:membrane-associated phospholipid phosphatase
MDLVRSSLRPEDVYQLVYGAVAMTVVLIGVDEPLRSPYLAAHAAITAVVLLAPPAATIWPVMPLRLVRDLYHLPAGLFYYRETAALHHVVWGDRSFDGLVIGLDQLLFNGQPSLSFARHFPGAGFSAVMHLAYLSYYLLVIAGALALWSCPDAVRVYPRSAHAVAFTMLVCCAMFVAFPVVGPSYYWPDLPFEASPGAAVMRVFDGILALEVPTGAMPSSHVAVTVALLVAFWHHLRRAFWVSVTPAALLIVSTVYVRAHYASDAVVGLIVGLIAPWLAERIRVPVARRLGLAPGGRRLGASR